MPRSPTQRGGEGEEREAEEEGEVGPEDAVGDVLEVVDEVVVVDPVDAGLDEAEEIDGEEREEGVEAVEVGDVFGGDVELEHHDGDDDGDDSVGEGFEAAGGERFGHGGLGGKDTLS